MKEKFKYRFDESSGILYKFYYGPITLEDIYSSWDFVISNNLIPKETKGFLLDYREAEFDIEIREYHKIPEYYKKHLDVFGGCKIAILTQSKKDIAIPVLVESKDDGYSSRPFYTLQAAVQWVLT